MADACAPWATAALTTGPLAKAIKEVVGPAELLSCKPVIKTGVIKHPSPWHQDHVYWGGSHKVSAWIALDDAAVPNGCLKIVPNTHREAKEHETFDAPDGFDWRINEATGIDSSKVVDVPLQAGSVLLFHDWLFHASHPNSSGADRYCLIPTFRCTTEPDSATVWENITPTPLE
jgi:phytanoyl-CoA hydroxylase